MTDLAQCRCHARVRRLADAKIGELMKSRIVEELGHGEIVLPSLVADGLRANDRAKVRMSLLQAAAQHARDPNRRPADLSAECRLAGIDAVAARALVAEARLNEAGTIEAPGLGKLTEVLIGDVATMIEAVAANDARAAKSAEDRLAAARVKLNGQGLSPDDIVALTGVSESGDSLHRLVMDLHRALNRLAAQCAGEVISGAHAYGIAADDRPVISAFMHGLERTRGLKFDHPGLDTMAIRAGSRLIIQNDIGTTDAHVLLVTIERLTITITHTDVHESRAEFFIDLFRDFPVKWSGLHQEQAEGLCDKGTFYLVTGAYAAESVEKRDALLAAIGAALVFLIDWNKARKALRKLIRNGDAIRVLTWGARHEVGHRAFLQLGGIDLIASAVRHAAPAQIGFGQDLGAVLGRESTVEFLKSALRLSAEALLNDRGARSVREALEADLVGRIKHNESALLAIVVRQLGLCRDIAASIAAGVANGTTQMAARERNARRAKHAEEKGDAIAAEARTVIGRTQASHVVAELVTAAENTIDELEQAAFLTSLLPMKLEPSLLVPLGELSEVAIGASETAARGLNAAAGLAEGTGIDAEDALAAVDRLIDFERAADRAERDLTSVAFKAEGDVKTALPALEVGRALERASDRMASIGHLLRDHVMSVLSH